MENNQSVKTEILTLEKIHQDQYQFVIPSYQRPYVWSDDDVLLLFNDIKKACAAKEPNYFIGTILSSRSEKTTDNKCADAGTYELIDGQQRTTTLMLMTIAFKAAGIDSALNDVAVVRHAEGKFMPRLTFEIRDQVQQLLGGLAGLAGYQVPSQEMIDTNAYLKQLHVALKVLSKAVDAVSEDADGITAKALADYLYRHVHWVNNRVPQQMDLNRLFATMNTAGIQLEQSDLLKAKLFKNIQTEKAQYDAMWVACEHMENYFERNVRQVFPNADWRSIEPHDLSEFTANRFKPESTEGGHDKPPSRTIAALAKRLDLDNQPRKAEDKPVQPHELDVETVYCRPIISFSLLLIHAYRIHLALSQQSDIQPRLHSDRLLEIFEPLIQSDESKVKRFIEQLWQVRYQFDRWVVKWVESDDSADAQLGLTYQSRSQSNKTYYINRTQKELTDMVLLQSVRNFTGERSAQYWLTPFLSQLIANAITDEASALGIMEHIDNRMSLSIDTQKVASFLLSQGQAPKMNTWAEQANYFKQSLGTRFEHYWFQKLEYLLWKSLRHDEPSLSDVEREKFQKYRITSKNSVEHVHPQHEEYGAHVGDKALNAFGNLVLLSPGENSSYSNQDVDKKIIDFHRKDHFDSLKLRAIVSLKGESAWDAERIALHQHEMMKMMAQHYDSRDEQGAVATNRKH